MRLLLATRTCRVASSEPLAADFPDSTHVVECDIDTSADKEVWDFAGQRGYIIVSKDSDHRCRIAAHFRSDLRTGQGWVFAQQDDLAA